MDYTNLSFHDIIDDERELSKTRKNILVAENSQGKITIENTGLVIIAKLEGRDRAICSSHNLNENGLRWVKKECRGWIGWERLKWNVVSVPRV